MSTRFAFTRRRRMVLSPSKAPLLSMFACVLACFVSLSAHAQIPSSKVHVLLDEARVSLERGEFGASLAACERARALHRTEIEGHLGSIENAVRPAAVKNAGDDIALVRETLASRGETEAVAALDLMLASSSGKVTGKGLGALLDWARGRVVLPEADILSGSVYEAEGEYAMASRLYLSAWDNRAFLDIPDERFTVLYALSDLARRARDPVGREKYLLAVLSEDSLFGKPGEESPSLKAMIKTLEGSRDTGKLFSLYRHRAYFALKAYQDLSSFYFLDSKGRVESALSVSLLASIVTLSALEDVLVRQDFEFEYRSFDDVLRRAAGSAEIMDWANRHDAWNTFLLFARILHERGNVALARSIRSDLALNCPDPTVARKATSELAKDSIPKE